MGGSKAMGSGRRPPPLRVADVAVARRRGWGLMAALLSWRGGDDCIGCGRCVFGEELGSRGKRLCEMPKVLSVCLRVV